MSEYIAGIDHLAMTVADLEEARDFYGRVLGAQVVREYESDGKVFVLQLRLGGAMLNLHQSGHSRPLVAARPTPGAVDICFRWDAPIELAVTHRARAYQQLHRCPPDTLGAPGNDDGPTVQATRHKGIPFFVDKDVRQRE